MLPPECGRCFVLPASSSLAGCLNYVPLNSNRHRPSGTVIAEGPLGWGIMPFEGNYYISSRYLKAGRFSPNWMPGLCVYKFLYVWIDLHLPDGQSARSLGWLYWLPNPLLPFIWFRVAVSGSDETLSYEKFAP